MDDRRSGPRALASFPVRFAAAGEARVAAARDLGQGGIFVRCANPPRVGEEVLVALHLPDDAPPLELRASVRRAVPRAAPPASPGFAAQFIEIPPDARVRIGAFIRDTHDQTHTPAAGTPRYTEEGRDRREFARYRAAFRVQFASTRDFVVEYAENISRGGVFIATSSPAPRDATIDVRLELPDGGPAAEAVARVVHVSEHGMGCQFIEMPDAFRARLDAFLERLAREDDPL